MPGEFVGYGSRWFAGHGCAGRDSNVRFLIYGLNFSPELTGIGKYSGELAEELVDRGHEVHVVTAPPYYPDWRVHEGYRSWWYSSEESSRLRIRRCPLWVPKKPGGTKRLLHLTSFALSSLPVAIAEVRWKPDLVLSVEPTLLSAPGALLVARLSGAPSWLHVQDLEMDAAFELGLLGSGFLHRSAIAFERSMLKRFSVVSTISQSMAARLADKDAVKGPVIPFSNWVDTSAIYPLEGPSTVRRELDIDDEKIVALYSGNMGNKQGLGILAETARALVSDSNIHFVFCGAGSGKADLMRACADLNNVTFMDLQPVERLNDLLGVADIHLLPQRADAEELVLPSKVSGMLASGRPIVATATPDSELACLIKTCGEVVEPGNTAEFAVALRDLREDPDRRVSLGQAARERAVHHFSKDRIIDDFLEKALKLIDDLKSEVQKDHGND